MTKAYPDEKEIIDIDRVEVKLLWKGGIKVTVGQYYCNLIGVPAISKSNYLKTLIVDSLHYDLNSLENYVLYTGDVNNTKVFTHFWNWLNGATKNIRRKDFVTSDYIDMLNLISFFWVSI